MTLQVYAAQVLSIVIEQLRAQQFTTSDVMLPSSSTAMCIASLRPKVDLSELLTMGTVPRILPKGRAHTSRTVELYSERSINSERDLLDFIEALDEDEGIRIDGNLKNHENGGFVFVGTYRGSYCVNICDKVWAPKLRGYVARGKDEWYYFDKGKEAFRFVLKEAKRPLRAWLY